MARGQGGSDRGVLPAEVRAGTEPGRVPELRPQGEHQYGWLAARPRGVAREVAPVNAEAVETARASSQLLPAQVHRVCCGAGTEPDTSFFLAGLIAAGSLEISASDLAPGGLM